MVKIQLESLFEKIQINGDKLFRIENDMADLKERSGKFDSRQMIEKIVGARFGEVELELQKLKEENFKKLAEIDNKWSSQIYQTEKNLSNPTGRIRDSGPLALSGDFSHMQIARIKKIVKDETDHHLEFIQQFVNEEAINQMRIMKNDKKSTTQKMDAVDWYSRNIEFVDKKILNRFIAVCNELRSDPKNIDMKLKLLKGQHDSLVLKNLRRLIIETQDVNADEATNLQLPFYLRLLDIALFNDTCATQAQELSIDILMLNIITDSVGDNQSQSKNASLKSSAKSITQRPKIDEMSKNLAKSCLNSILEVSVSSLGKIAQSQFFIQWISHSLDDGLKLQSVNRDSWISTFNIIKHCFRSTEIAQNCLKQNGTFINDLIRVTRDSIIDEDVLELNLKVRNVRLTFTEGIQRVLQASKLD